MLPLLTQGDAARVSGSVNERSNVSVSAAAARSSLGPVRDASCIAWKISKHGSTTVSSVPPAKEIIVIG